MDKPPNVCTRCPQEKSCKRNHAYYTAHRAHAEYNKSLSSSRKGIRTDPERLLELNEVEMETVLGARNSGNVLLTMLFRETNFMLFFLLPDKSHQSVRDVFDRLNSLMGIDLFRKLFPVILTDNGTEFKGVHNLEFSENGARRTRIFYCDPQASWQKGRIEKNHVLIRQILPKGTLFSKLDDTDIHLIVCHINSVVRELFDNQTPFDLMQKKEAYKKLLDILALQPIPLDEVLLKPALLKRKK